MQLLLRYNSRNNDHSRITNAIWFWVFPLVSMLGTLKKTRSLLLIGMLGGLLWFALVSIFSELYLSAALLSGVWNGLLAVGIWLGAQRIDRWITSKQLSDAGSISAHCLAAVLVACIWTLLSITTWVALTDWFIEGELEQIVFFDWLESLFDRAEEYFPSDPGWVAYRWVLGLMGYILSVVMHRANIAITQTKNLKRQIADKTADIASTATLDEHHYLVIRDAGRTHKLFKNDIELLESDRDYVRIDMPKKQFLVRFALRKFELELQSDSFMRIHRSRIVNLQHVESIAPLGDGRANLHLRSGNKVQTSRQGGRLIREHMSNSQRYQAQLKTQLP